MSVWLVARVMLNLESEIAARLARLDVESYWPRFRESVVDRRTHRRRRAVKPLYPCYLFVRTSLFYFLYGIDGITGIVMSGASPARSRRLDVEIELMRSSELDGFVPAPVVAEAPRLVAGARVVILSGVLQGHIGVCEETRGRSASVLTNLFGRQTPAWHSEADLAVA